MWPQWESKLLSAAQASRTQCYQNSEFYFFVKPQLAHFIFTFAHYASKVNSSGLFALVYHSDFRMIYHTIVHKQTYGHTIHLLTRNQSVSSIQKQRIPVLLCGRLSSLTILSWLYLGINRNPRKYIHPRLKKFAIQPNLFYILPSFAWKLQIKSPIGKMCGHTVAPSVGSELLHPASTSAHKTVVPAIITIFKNSANQNGIFAICSLRMLLVH